MSLEAAAELVLGLGGALSSMLAMLSRFCRAKSSTNTHRILLSLSALRLRATPREESLSAVRDRVRTDGSPRSIPASAERACALLGKAATASLSLTHLWGSYEFQAKK